MRSHKRPRSIGRLAIAIRKAERAILLRTIRKNSGHIFKSANWLGICRRAMTEKIRDHGLDGEASGLRAESGIRGPRK